MTKRDKAFKFTLKFLKAYNEGLKKGRKAEAIKALNILFPKKTG